MTFNGIEYSFVEATKSEIREAINEAIDPEKKKNLVIVLRLYYMKDILWALVIFSFLSIVILAIAG